MGISDRIESFIIELMKSETGYAEFGRNELAEIFGCVPSQINYVLSTRFTSGQGYIVESRRGGGGYIRVQRIRYNAVQAALMHIVNSVGDTLSAVTANAILANLVDRRIVEEKTARLVGAALSDKAYRNVAVADRDRLRAALLKQMLTTLADS